ncbi:O-antigen ligase family protein [Pseudoflavonifractor sp. P01025]|uniref:O-antigen ligase family protein n=1 Tax=Flintibacter porci TaxID=3342383 RepID=UPI0035B5A572
MKIRRRDLDPQTQIAHMEYPVGSMAICLLLIYLSPFVSLALNYLAFAVCIYRFVRYDESVFAIDYCVLAGVSYIFLTTGRVSLLAWLSIIFAVWHIIKNGAQGNTSFVLLLILFDYMLLRTGTAINDFVLCFSQLLLLFVLLSTQKKSGIVPSALAFCGNVILSSIYALVFRESAAIRTLLGNEVHAYWGSSLTRFQGLFRDPNYYMTLLLVSIALLAVLFMNQHITRKVFIVATGILVLLGALTYSKTFIVVLMAFTAFFIIRLFRGGHYLVGLGSVLVIALVGIVLSDTVFAVTIYRITSTNNLYDLTTGRSELLVEYFAEITKSVSSFFFGAGLSASILERGTHNLFLEIIYYFGLVGFLLISAYTLSLLHLVTENLDRNRANPNGMFRYAVLVVFLLLFCTLQGMTFSITYVMLYLAILATEIMPSGKLPNR